MNQHLATSGILEQQQNSHYREGRFVNESPVASKNFFETAGIFWRFFTEKKIDTEPKVALPTQSLTKQQLLELSEQQVHLVKLGHSSILLKVYGEFWLIDPVFSERASPFSFMGPKRFHSSPIALADLPKIDKVLISHNHYDHLDKATIQQLSQQVEQLLVPLGVAEDLVKWGVKQDKILSFDWWQELETAKALIAYTPARHFSGRAMSDGNRSLWGSWSIITANERLFFSGDSGYFDGFTAIGQKYGPFDLTLIETGAYDENWPEIHMTPEQSVQAHIDLQGKVMMPIHNGTFDLAFHTWYEPLERVTQAAEQQQVALSTPQFGQLFQVQHKPFTQRWWRPLID